MKGESGCPRLMLYPMLTCPWDMLRCKEEVLPMRHTVMNSHREAVRKFMVVLDGILRDFRGQGSPSGLEGDDHPHRPG